MEIGAKIKQLRFKAGLTQEQLADRLGISSQSVSKWETFVTMPDISLLPLLAEEFGVTIDELFDLTADQKLNRIEKRIELEEEFSPETFAEYEAFLQEQLAVREDKYPVISCLAHLYYHRMESDARVVSKYARESIRMKPEQKDCQWFLDMAEGQRAWDWNISNHASLIDFYKEVIRQDSGTPKTPMPYYYLIDNLLADHRTKEAADYLEQYSRLPAHKPFMVAVYRAHIALAEYDEPKADGIMEAAEQEHGENGAFLFEAAQYYARKAEYEKAIRLYEASWEMEPKPRYVDALQGIAIIYGILGDKEKAAQTYDRWLVCLKEEWGYADDDKAVLETERNKKKLLQG